MFAHQLSDSDGNTRKAWREYKEMGKRHFQGGNFTAALDSYQSAINHPSLPKAERAILLSNSIACRLKIGTREMALIAVDEAKKCISLNKHWPKAHIRLASSYVALGNGHSNDACNALQQALQLDPNHAIARKMLRQELKRDRTSTRAEEHTIEVDEDDYTNDGVRPSAPSASTTNTSTPVYTDAIPEDEAHLYPNTTNDEIDDSLSWNDRWNTARQWYNQEVSTEWKSLVKVLIGLLILYIAFGGRFGLNTSVFQQNTNTPTRGNYGTGNAYDRFRNTNGNHDTYDRYRNGNNNNYGSSSSSSSSSSRQQQGYDDRTNYHHDHNSDQRRTSSRDSSYYSNNNYYGGGGGGMSYWMDGRSNMFLIAIFFFILNRINRFYGGAGAGGAYPGMRRNGNWQFGAFPMGMGMGAMYGGRPGGMRFRFGGGGQRRRWR